MTADSTTKTQLSHKSALVIVDMQNGFVHDQGFMKKIGFDITLSQAAINPIKDVLDAARKANIPIIFTRMTLKQDYSDAGLLAFRSPAIVQAQGMIENSWDNAIINELQPQDGELVVDKTRYSAFFKTRLLEELVRREIDQIILTGVTTNVCVEGTGRDAYANDIKVIILSDGTGAVTRELHESSLASMKYGMGHVVPTAEVIEALQLL